jgi:hypothetical protein
MTPVRQYPLATAFLIVMALVALYMGLIARVPFP